MARGFPYRLKIAEIGKHSANMIKLTCHGTGSRIVTMLYPFQLAHLTSPTMSPFQVLLHIRHLRHGWSRSSSLSFLMRLSRSINAWLRSFCVRNTSCLSLRRSFFSKSLKRIRKRMNFLKRRIHTGKPARILPEPCIRFPSVLQACHADSLASHCAKEWSSVTRAVS